MNARIGFIGLGNLGSAIAGRLIATGANLTVWNRSPEKAARVSASRAETPRAVAEAADVIVLNLFDSAAVRDVLSGPNGLLQGPLHGTLVIDTTTNHPHTVLAFHNDVRAAGGSYLEAPVLGSVVPASQGKLVILVSGEKSAYDRSLDLLRIIGGTTFYLGEPGKATRMKLVNNLVLGSFMASLAEALATGKRLGLERDLMTDILGVGAGDSMVLRGKKDKLIREDFSPHFSNEAIAKDLRYLQEIAGSSGRDLLMGKAALALYSRAIEAGFGREDFSAVLRVSS